MSSRRISSFARPRRVHDGQRADLHYLRMPSYFREFGTRGRDQSAVRPRGVIKALRLLCTNDDGILAQGLACLIEAAEPLGEITVVCSGSWRAPLKFSTLTIIADGAGERMFVDALLTIRSNDSYLPSARLLRSDTPGLGQVCVVVGAEQPQRLIPRAWRHSTLIRATRPEIPEITGRSVNSGDRHVDRREPGAGRANDESVSNSYRCPLHGPCANIRFDAR